MELPVVIQERRRFLRLLAATGAAAVAALPRVSCGDAAGKPLEIGHAEIDITPPHGIELAGFHRAVGNERKITGARQPSAARALVLRVGNQTVVLVSLDIILISQAFTAAVQRLVAEQAGIPAANVRVCASHSHSMPAFVFLRQWGAIPIEYEQQVRDKIVRAVCQAKDDLAAGELYLGKNRVVGGNSNRTAHTWKTDAEFDAESTDADRWLDTTLHVLRFERAGKPNVLWYHFSCHPVCYEDNLSGPDWLGLVTDHVRTKHRVSPGFLQGHAGDVNPGNGTPWIGEPQSTANAISAGFDAALAGAQRVSVESLATTSVKFSLPLDLDRFRQELAAFRAAPKTYDCGVDPPFAKDWFAWAEKYDQSHTTYATPMSALRLGDLGCVFHSSELYSYYGLATRRDSPFADTLVVGYADDAVGYIADPKAFEAEEYAAVIVPRILCLPPYATTTGRQISQHMVDLLKKVAV